MNESEHGDVAMESSGEFFEGPAREQAHLERAHHEICTALTVLRSNVDLVRIELRDEADPGMRVAVHRHLTELDAAVERLQHLAAAMRSWHADNAQSATAERASQTLHHHRILP